VNKHIGHLGVCFRLLDEYTSVRQTMLQRCRAGEDRHTGTTAVAHAGAAWLTCQNYQVPP